MRTRWVVYICVVAAGLVSTPAAVAGEASEIGAAPAGVHLLDVPYVSQSDALCGGAALAMVLRYWGMADVLAEDFAPLLDPEQAGIRADVLVKAARASGWGAFPWFATPAEVQSHLLQGRPVIALIQTASDSYHYVVLLTWINGWVVLHDPGQGPFRAIRESEFGAAWAGSSDWALLVLPPHDAEETGSPSPREAGTGPSIRGETVPPSPTVSPALLQSPTGVSPERCGAMLSAGIVLAQQGRVAEAELQFVATQSLFPSSAAPLRERAGLRFLAEDWEGAIRLAEESVALDPIDAHTWRLLATSRFLAGDVEGALGAWNRVSEPRLDLTHIDGLTHLRYSVVTDQIQLRPGQLLTPRAFRRASRRLAEMPAPLESRLSLRPVPEGRVQVMVALVERPPVHGGPWDLARTSLAALMGREVALDVTNPMGIGEVWTAGWRWWEDRPRVSLTLTAPAAGGSPGIWRLDSFWERQTYEGWTLVDSEDTTLAKPVVEERRRTALSFSDWVGPDLRLEVGAGLDKWADRGSHLSFQAAVETRWVRDRLALTTQLARWNDLGKGPAFSSGLLSVRWCPSGLGTAGPWQGMMAVSAVTAKAPLALWTGAGTGYGRTPLLRAHPLLDGGVFRSRGIFGRTLLHGTLERRAHSWNLGGLRLGWVLFIDGAKPWHTGRIRRAPWQVDGGTGLRLQGLGTNGQLRIDAAVGLGDGSSAISVGWQIPSH